nr:PREDICTED: odorant receptor 49b-like [Megachile rotundata]
MIHYSLQLFKESSPHQKHYIKHYRSIISAMVYRNASYKLDTEYTIRFPKALLTPIGIWPLYQDDTALRKTRRQVQIALIFCSMCFLLIPHAIYTYHDCEDLKRYMKVIAAQVFSLLGIVKFWTIIINKNEISFCLTELELQYRDVECEEDRKLIRESAKIGRFFAILYLGLSYGGALPYHLILPLLSEKVVKSDNTTQIPLPYLSNYVFFVIEDSPFYEMTFAFQMFISIIILSTNCGIYILIAGITMHCSGLFEVINRKIDLFMKETNGKLRDRLRFIIQRHVQATEYAAMIEKTFNVVFLSEMLGNTVIICFLEYGVLVEWEDHKTLSTMTYFILMTSILSNVFIISFIGDRLKQVSTRVGRTAYFLPWFELPMDVVKDVSMVILRTSRPSSLSAGKLFDLSLQGFCDVFKTSAAYLNFLRTMTA